MSPNDPKRCYVIEKNFKTKNMTLCYFTSLGIPIFQGHDPKQIQARKHSQVEPGPHGKIGKLIFRNTENEGHFMFKKRRARKCWQTDVQYFQNDRECSILNGPYDGSFARNYVQTRSCKYGIYVNVSLLWSLGIVFTGLTVKTGFARTSE